MFKNNLKIKYFLGILFSFIFFLFGTKSVSAEIIEEVNKYGVNITEGVSFTFENSGSLVCMGSSQYNTIGDLDFYLDSVEPANRLDKIYSFDEGQYSYYRYAFFKDYIESGDYTIIGSLGGNVANLSCFIDDNLDSVDSYSSTIEVVDSSDSFVATSTISDLSNKTIYTHFRSSSYSSTQFPSLSFSPDSVYNFSTTIPWASSGYFSSGSAGYNDLFQVDSFDTEETEKTIDFTIAENYASSWTKETYIIFNNKPLPTNDYLLIYDGGYYDDPDNELANIEDIYRYIHPPYASGKTYSNTPAKFAYNFCDYLNNEYISKGLCVDDNTNCPDFIITQHYEPKTGSNVYPDYDIIKSVPVSLDSCSGVYEFYPDDTPLKDGKTFISLYDENTLAQVAISNEVNYEITSYDHLLFGDNFLRLNGNYNYTKKFHFGYSYSNETFSIPVVWDFCGLDWYDDEVGYEVCLSGSERYCVVADSCSGFGDIEHPVPDNNQTLICTLLVLEPSPSVNSPYIANNYWFTIEKEALRPVDTSYENFCLNTTEDFFSWGFCFITKELFNPIFNTIKIIPSQIFPINVFNTFYDIWEESSNKALSSDFTFLFSSVSSSGEVIIDLPDRLFPTNDDFVIFSKNWFVGDSVLFGFFTGFKKITPYLFFAAYLAFLYSLLRKVKNNNID